MREIIHLQTGMLTLYIGCNEIKVLFLIKFYENLSRVF